ncbi:MAG: rRNA maturation RNase YbeY [bacterium]
MSEASLVSALESFLNHLGRSETRVSVMFGDDAALRELNHRFRGLDRPTDVLSWCYPDDPGPAPLLGEIAISLERAESQAGENGWDLQTEVLRLLAHGCAHLAGHDHQDEAEERGMKALEIEMLSGVGLRDIYPADG